MGEGEEEQQTRRVYQTLVSQTLLMPVHSHCIAASLVTFYVFHIMATFPLICHKVVLSVDFGEYVMSAVIW